MAVRELEESTSHRRRHTPEQITRTLRDGDKHPGRAVAASQTSTVRLTAGLMGVELRAEATRVAAEHPGKGRCELPASQKSPQQSSWPRPESRTNHRS